MIINAHAHLGYDYVFDDNETEEELIKWHDEYSIENAIVQPFVPRPYIEDTREYHDRIYRLCCKYPGRFYGMASINPHFKPVDFEAEAERCIKELGFVGIKMTPIAHAVNPNSKDGIHLFDVAESLNIPVMVHTGSGAPFSDPVNLIKIAEGYKKFPIILAHAGTDLLFTQALYVASKFENVYLEPSWLGILSMKKALKTVGAGKIMFSSDHCINIPIELTKYKTLTQDEKILEQLLSGTAKAVFSI